MLHYNQIDGTGLRGDDRENSPSRPWATYDVNQQVQIVHCSRPYKENYYNCCQLANELISFCNTIDQVG